MDVIEIKSKLQKIIDQLDDVNLLQAIHTLLEKKNLDPQLKSKLSQRAEKAEEDIALGRVFSIEEVVEKTYSF